MDIGKLAAIIAVCAVTGAAAWVLIMFIDRYVTGLWITVASLAMASLAVVLVVAALLQHFPSGKEGVSVESPEVDGPEAGQESLSAPAGVPGP